MTTSDPPGGILRLMFRHARLAPVFLLLAAMASPVIGAPRPLESLRLVVAIQWLSEDQTAVEMPAVEQPVVHRSPTRVSSLGAPDSHARSTALSPLRFQRPPPPTSLRS